jgi:arylsulfatase A-like enzyme
MYEGGIHVPLIAYWPGKIKPGQQSNHIAAAWDILPTLCEAAGIKTDKSLDGISFLPTLTGRKQKPHDYLYWEYYEYNYNWDKPANKLPRNWLENAAVRMGKWKAVKKDLLKATQPVIELYDLENDPSEKSDVAAANPEVMKRIEKIFTEASIPNTPYFPYQQTARR